MNKPPRSVRFPAVIGNSISRSAFAPVGKQGSTHARSGSQNSPISARHASRSPAESAAGKGSYSVAKLYAERGDLRLTDFLSERTSACPNARSIGWHERCAARFVLGGNGGGEGLRLRRKQE